MTGVHVEEERAIRAPDTQGEYHVTIKTKFAVMQPKVKKHQGWPRIPEVGKKQRKVLPYRFQSKSNPTNTFILDF